MQLIHLGRLCVGAAGSGCPKSCREKLRRLLPAKRVQENCCKDSPEAQHPAAEGIGKQAGREPVAADSLVDQPLEKT